MEYETTHFFHDGRKVPGCSDWFKGFLSAHEELHNKLLEYNYYNPRRKLSDKEIFLFCRYIKESYQIMIVEMKEEPWLYQK